VRKVLSFEELIQKTGKINFGGQFFWHEKEIEKKLDSFQIDFFYAWKLCARIGF
jgi:hypothetical protein